MPYYRITYRETELRTTTFEADSESAARQAFIDGVDYDLGSSLIETESSEIIDIEEDT